MRLRNDKNAINILLANQKWFVLNPKALSNDKGFMRQPIYLEIGMGKGNFIINHALHNPNISYVGLEKNQVICSKAIKKILETNQALTNLKIINTDAKLLTEIFQPKSIDKIFLNFSDPWPKKRHTKNRLTNPIFLNIYEQILKPDAVIELKTDNDDFFSYTIDVLNQYNQKYEIIYQTTNLYQELTNEFNINNIATEYETRFHNLGKNINKVIFKIK